MLPTLLQDLPDTCRDGMAGKVVHPFLDILVPEEFIHRWQLAKISSVYL
jgi:hypothetical protein